MKNTIIKLVIVIMVLGTLIFIYIRQPSTLEKNLESTTSTSTELIIMTPETIQISPTERKYQNLLFRFSLIYPKDLIVKEYDDGTAASTITFEDEAGKNSFQVFIVPYQSDHITKEQFKRDVPSGVMTEPKDIFIDNVPATIFFSYNQVLGDTREVWFIHNGFLFEITTKKEHDAWLSQMMKSWHFF